MTTLSLNIDGAIFEAGYKTLFRRIIRVEVISPYKGIKYEFTTDIETADLYDPEQAKEFVEEILRRLYRQIRVVETYLSIYRALNDRYVQITELMWNVLERMHFNNASDKFWYLSELQKRILDEFYHELKVLIPDNKVKYRGDSLIHPALLSQILSVI